MLFSAQRIYNCNHITGNGHNITYFKRGFHIVYIFISVSLYLFVCNTDNRDSFDLLICKIDHCCVILN